MTETDRLNASVARWLQCGQPQEDLTVYAVSTLSPDGERIWYAETDLMFPYRRAWMTKEAMRETEATPVTYVGRSAAEQSMSEMWGLTPDQINLEVVTCE